MGTKPRAFARRVGQTLAVAVVIGAGGGIVASPAHALLPAPAVTSVFATGPTPTRVVTAGTTVAITGTGFAGMVDNDADPACSVTPVASSRCSQVRFNGVSANVNATGYTLALSYVVVSDTKIYVAVPTIAAVAPALGAPAAGTGSVKIVVVNTSIGGTSSLSSAPGATGATELLYRHRLTATVQNATVTASSVGGATVAVDITPVTALTSGPTGTLATEKITAYFTSATMDPPLVPSTSVAFNDNDTVDVLVPAGTPSGDFVGIMLVHDGILGTADNDSLTYAAVITNVETCEAFTPPVVTPFPVCTGPGHTSASPFFARLTGKGITGATDFSFDGSDGHTEEDCSIASDTVAYCSVVVNTIPSFPVVAVAFTPADPDGAGPVTAPAFGDIGVGSVFSFFD